MPARDQRVVLPATAHLPPQASRVGHSAAAPPPPTASTQAQQQAAADALSVILVTGSYDGTIRYWEAWSGICSRTIQTQDHQPNRLAISPDKRFLAAAGVNTVKLYDVAQSAAASSTNVAPLVTLQGHTANVTSLAWQNEAKWLVSGSEDGTVKIWDVRTSSPQRNYAHLASVNDLALHSNQGELVSCDQNGAIKVWDLGGDRCSHELVSPASLSREKNPRPLTRPPAPRHSCRRKTSRCGASRSLQTDPPSSAETTRCLPHCPYS